MPPEVLSVENYQQLQSGMTHQEAMIIIGVDGQEVATTGNIKV
jgi:hypothetical protein